MMNTLLKTIAGLAMSLVLQSCESTYRVASTDIEMLGPNNHGWYYGVVTSLGDSVKFHLPAGSRNVDVLDSIDVISVNLREVNGYCEEYDCVITYFTEQPN